MGATSLIRYEDFSGGHWGAQGGVAPLKNGWGGVNMLLTRAGTLAPAAASRPLIFENLADGRVLGVFWAWGVDGYVYFLQGGLTGDDAAKAQIRRFNPSFVGSTVTVEDVGAPIAVPAEVLDPDGNNVHARPPAWTAFSDKVYMTVWGGDTWEINPTGPSRAVLTGAPGGRAITSFGERLLVGGLDDDTFGTIGNRIAFTEPGDLNTWPGLNFFDVGTDLTEIAGLYVMLDVLIIIFSDQTMHTFRGVPGSGTNASQRKVYGFHAGSGGIDTFVHSNAVVDPAQARLWFFDHTQRGVARFNGSVVQHVGGFGVITGERTSALNPDGVMVAHGGPDDVIIDRVPVPRGAGEGAAGESNLLVHVNGAFGLVDQGVVRAPKASATPSPPPEPGSLTFSYNGVSGTVGSDGTGQEWVVPDGITSISFDGYGAQGGQRTAGTAKGARLVATIAVTPGETLTVYVGGCPQSRVAGWNGGGEAGNPSVGGWGGGGASDVRRGTTLADRLAVAAGGGGDGSYDSGGATTAPGGAGGATTGADGGYYPVFGATFRGQGATVMAGGAGGVAGVGAHPATAGAIGVGGAGWGASAQLGRGGGGGGGGLYGGGGGGETGGGGGGSSGIPDATLVSAEDGARVGHGTVTISWPA